jgi:hypothetical protein
MQGQKLVRQPQGLQQPSAIYPSNRPCTLGVLQQISGAPHTHRKRGRALRVIQAPERELQADLADERR